MPTFPLVRALRLHGSQSSHSHHRDRPIRARAAHQGLTLLECLVAISVLGLGFAVALPPLFIATATRVQTRRADQALQLAQSEIDRIRTIVNRNEHEPAKLPAVASVPDGDVLAFEQVAAPTGTLSQLKSNTACSNFTAYNSAAVPVNRALPVDINSDCQPDLLLQVFRTTGNTTSSEESGRQRPSDFWLGVRVYSIVAGRDSNAGRFSPGDALSNLETEQASLSLTSGEQNQQTRPLAVLYTRISWSDRDSTLCNYHARDDDGDTGIESCQNTFDD